MFYKIKLKRVTAALMAFLLLLFVNGCGNTDGNGAAGTSQGSNGGNGEVSPEALGRYVEEVSDLSGKISGEGNRLYRLANGNLVISDSWTNFLKTGDDGKIWMTDSRRWRTKMMEDGVYVMNIAIGMDNTVGLIYQADVESTENDENEDEGPQIVLNPQLLIIKPDNMEILVEIALTEDDAYLDDVYIAENGRIFVTTRGTSNIYEVKEDGSSALFLMVEEGHPEFIQFQGNLMVMDAYGYDGLLLYDMEKKEYIEDDTLDDFISENYKDRQYGNMNAYDLFFFFGEEDIIYLAGEKGLHRHVIGGSVMEQLIDGKLCSLGNPSYALQGMLALENNEFLALFSGGKAVHYVYDPDIPTVPGEVLSVYALEDNEMMRQAINLYQTQHPDVYIEFTCGMGDNSVTREDALRTLNTKIIAGEGPDILLLDNMPIDSYIEKGLLLDLSSIIDSLSGDAELFGNIVDAMKKDGQLYAVPCEVNLPIMMTDKKYLSGVNDLADIADMVERLREDNPEQDLIGFCSEKSILRLFSMTCAPAWMTDSGEIDKDTVREFLQQTKRIYDTQMDGIPDRVIDNYESMADDYVMYNGVASFEDSDYVRMAGINQMNHVGGCNKVLIGCFDYLNITSITKAEGFENSEWAPMKGQGGNVFWAESLLGINAASEKPELVEDFLKVCLGKENQSYFYRSLPVNKAAFDESLAWPEDVESSGRYGSVSTNSYDGDYIGLVLYWPTEEEVVIFRQYMESVDTAYYENDIVENAVYEAGIAYMQGTQSLEEAVSAIEKKVSLYMAE